MMSDDANLKAFGGDDVSISRGSQSGTIKQDKIHRNLLCFELCGNRSCMTQYEPQVCAD